MAHDSEIIRISSLLHPSDSTQRIVCVLRAYFDDSGTHDKSKVLVVGGCVAGEKQWEFFETDWAAMLARFEIQEYHSADLQAFEGEFKGWTEQKRRDLIISAAEIGQRWAKNSFASAVIRTDYSEVVPEWAIETAAFGDQYNFCFQMSIGRIDGWIRRLQPPMPASDQVAFVFDQQPKREGVTRNTYSAIKKFRDRDNRMGSLAFLSSKRFLPLQFADFIAYEAYKQLDGFIGKPEWRTRAPLRILVETGYALEMSYFGRRDLEDLVRHYDEKGRPESGAEPWWPWDRST